MTQPNTKELQLLEKASSEFSKKILAPEREENDKYPFGPYFTHIIDKAYELDFFHITLPEHTGGIGHGIRAFCLVLEQICREDSSLGGIIFTNALAQEIFMASGQHDFLKNHCEKATNPGQFLLAFPSLLNPSETSRLPLARRMGDNYTLSGAMEYLVLGGMTQTAVIPAVIAGDMECSFFLTSLSSSGVSVGEPVMSHGLHACPAVDVILNDAKGILLGEEGKGMAYFNKASGTMQLAASAMALGIMKGSLNEAMTYCGGRVQGGRKLKDWSAMQMVLADMTIQTHVADMLVQRACQAIENQEKDWSACVQAASIHILSAATHLTSDGIQSMGGVGYMKDFGQEKRFRDAGHIQAMLGHAQLKKLRFIKQFL
ncbi:MAG: acyl-CoA dehydrogenase family protein [Desulfobacteraceae bacterium]